MSETRKSIPFLSVLLLAASAGLAQPAPVPPPLEPDAPRTQQELSTLLERYPPALRNVLALDPSLLGDQAYLAPYPGLGAFLKAHPEIARNPAYFLGNGRLEMPRDHESQVVDMWRDVFTGIAVLTGFALAIGLLIWLIRTLVDYRRWSRLAAVQAEAHTKILDRFTSSDDLRAYVASAAGAKFLESSPIALDAAPRSVGAPLSRILWSVQGGVVLIAAGAGLWVVSGQVTAAASQPLHALAVLAVALGIGFVVSAAISFFISQRLGLIEPPQESSVPEPHRGERPGA